MDANLGTVGQFKQQTGVWIDARGMGTTEGYKGIIFVVEIVQKLHRMLAQLRFLAVT